MKKRLLNKVLFKKLLLIIITLALFTPVIYADPPNPICVPTLEQPFSFLEALVQAKTNESNVGTKIVNTTHKKNGKESKVEGDTAKQNKIVNLWQDGDIYKIRLDIKDCSRKITINVFNMLGKKVLEVYEGYPYEDTNYEYDIKSYYLPNGIYLCVVQGANFRLPAKFIISR